MNEIQAFLAKLVADAEAGIQSVLSPAEVVMIKAWTEIQAVLSKLVSEAEAGIQSVITPAELATIKAWLANNASSDADEYPVDPNA